MSTDAPVAASKVDGPADHRDRAGAAGRAARRWFLIASPVLAGLFAILGAAADPAVGQDGIVLYREYAANPDPLQFKSVGFHFSYAFWIMSAMMLAALVRSRGVWVANVAGFLGWLGISSLPGLLFVDFYDSAIGQVGGAELTERVNQQMEGMWGVPVFALPGVIGLMLALPIAVAAAWRAGILRWWSLAAVLAGQAAFMVSGVAVWGTALTAACFTVFAVALWRGTRPAG
ncbi:MAG: hypothetical protein AVDCRST_MAG21-581 [uncultured Nocardioidaceae bacterium]|uniref:DUF4386 family protein n=1 Tax=uncultured Nocardioidaceae bacterium TaxID=253824 RepID=A0A6J4MV22_9ACTN|nr:MAG: hypothetical protein AVDCRST_MAG21-581 [uncultured Nocardioidaceae bacterium]